FLKWLRTSKRGSFERPLWFERARLDARIAARVGRRDRAVSAACNEAVPKGKIENKKSGYSVGPYLLFFFLFVILGSGLFQIIKAAKGGGPFSS
ncbi:unnamed protein product, partial [Laminaria digitata]